MSRSGVFLIENPLGQNVSSSHTVTISVEYFEIFYISNWIRERKALLAVCQWKLLHLWRRLTFRKIPCENCHGEKNYEKYVYFSRGRFSTLKFISGKTMCTAKVKVAELQWSG
jgi:hypothetical protein